MSKRKMSESCGAGTNCSGIPFNSGRFRSVRRVADRSSGEKGLALIEAAAGLENLLDFPLVNCAGTREVRVGLPQSISAVGTSEEFAANPLGLRLTDPAEFRMAGSIWFAESSL